MADADQVATDVLGGAGGKGAARFQGWLGQTPDPPATPDPDKCRLFTSPQFLEWLEIATSDILSQVDGPDGGSVIWVKRDAQVLNCRSGSASDFADLAERSAGDPTARWPPPHG